MYSAAGIQFDVRDIVRKLEGLVQFLRCKRRARVFYAHTEILVDEKRH